MIYEGSEMDKWVYINYNSNPADAASRGFFTDCDSNRIGTWIKGPKFLYSHRTVWPTPTFEVEYTEKNVHLLTDNSCNVISNVMNKFSIWTKAKMILGNVLIACKMF